MKRLIALLLLPLAFAASAASAAKEARELDWLEMMPKDEVDALMNTTAVDHSGMFKMEQTGSSRTVAELDGQEVKLPGYIVPLDTDEKGQLKEFFLVPYFGACIHVPPPPPNQIVLVRLAEPIPMTEIWDAFWVEGTMKIESQSNDMASSAYTIEAREVTLYQ